MFAYVCLMRTEQCTRMCHCMKVWIYNIFTTDQMWCKCVSKYGICDINTIVNIKLSFTIAEMSHIQYLHTHVHHI